MNKAGFTNTKKFKYGSMATLLTVAFIAFVVIFNVVFSALASKYMWYIDMTERQTYTLSDDAKDIMSDITEDVHIYFASEPDVLMNGTNSGYTRYIYTTALRLEEEYPNIHVDCISVLKNPGFFKQFQTTAATPIETTSVIMSSESETRVFAATAFFSFSDASDLSSVWAYNGEKTMLSGIMQVTQSETPIVSFTTEHGEDISSAVSLGNLFAENGFEVNTVNLANDTLDDDCRILVIYNPIYDFIGAEAEDDSKNEIEKIDKFLDEYGCLLVFCDPENTDKLTNLNEFLEEWGIKYVSSTTLKDTEHSMSTDGYAIIAEYQRDTLGASIYSDLNALVTPPKTVIRKTMPIEILWDEGGSTNNVRKVTTVLSSYDTAVAVKDGIEGEAGKYDIVTMTRETSIIDSESYYSYVFAFGSPSFASTSYIQSNAFANEDILCAAMKGAGRERVLAAIERKPFDDSTITITTAESNRWTVAMTVALPLIFGICGIVVITRRKHS